MNEFEVFFIRSLPPKFLTQTLESFFRTIPVSQKNVTHHVIEEKQSREHSLNYILSQRNKNKDLLIVSDDVIFLPKWYENLQENYSNGDVMGFSMIYPDKNTIQDFGYDLIKKDDQLVLDAVHRGSDVHSMILPPFRECDSVNGCTMFIKRDVLVKIPEFSLDGNNRWGESIFCYTAKRKNFKIIVLSTHLKHYGISTKQKKDILKSSVSWIVEKEIWSNISKKYFLEAIPKKNIETKIDQNIINIINSKFPILIYGCGTISKIILDKIPNKQNVTLCSGLNEEIGKCFFNLNVNDVNKLNLNLFSSIIITAIGYEKDILQKYFNDILQNNSKIILLKKNRINFFDIIQIK